MELSECSSAIHLSSMGYNYSTVSDFPLIMSVIATLIY
jgi:hypothetical protein